MLARAILAIGDAALRKELYKVLVDLDVVVDTVRARGQLWERVSEEAGDLLVVSREMIPEPIAETVGLFRQLPDSPAVIVVWDGEDLEERAALLAAGCEAVLNPDLAAESISGVLAAILEKREEIAVVELEAERPLSSPSLSDFVSDSPAMTTFMKVVERVVGSNVPLLLLGETGVGKERLARAIHAEGAKGAGPFVAVNCGAFPETLLESELFGHEQGAFTGAIRSRRGYFELAHGGTMFLDEVGEMPFHLQVKLLRVLQEHEIQRIGGEKALTVDVRVMAASNKDLSRAVEEGRFRQDLFYRLAVVTLTVPPLRDRREDIPALVENYLGYLRPRVGREVTSIADDALGTLSTYPWPGNVRELINVIERAMLLSSTDRISLEDLPEAISGVAEVIHERSLATPAGESREWLQKPLREVRKRFVEEMERGYLAGLLSETGGKVGETAKRAGIEPRSLYDKMKRYGLRKEDFRRANRTSG